MDKEILRRPKNDGPGDVWRLRLRAWKMSLCLCVLDDRLWVWLASWLPPPSDNYKGPTCIISGIETTYQRGYKPA